MVETVESAVDAEEDSETVTAEVAVVAVEAAEAQVEEEDRRKSGFQRPSSEDW